MNDLRTHPAAQTEFEAAVDWYAEKSTAVAYRFVGEVEAAIHAIRKHPERYARVDEMHRLYLVNRFPYYIAYRQMKDVVEIVAIRHSSQDQDRWKSR